MEQRTKEDWVDIIGFEGLYRISNLGRVKMLAKTWRVNKGGICSIGESYKKFYKRGQYPMVQLRKNGKFKSFLVHRLVAIHFIPNPENKREVNHIDGNKNNTSLSNLEWNTPEENMKHAYSIGLLPHLDKINKKHGAKN